MAPLSLMERGCQTKMTKDAHLAVYRLPASSLAFYKAYVPWDSNQGHRCPQPTLILTQISWSDMWPDHIPTTDISPRPIIPSRSCRSISLLLRHSKYPQPTSVLSNQRQGSSTSGKAHPNLSPDAKASTFFPTGSASDQIFCNECRGSLRYCQPMLGMSNGCCCFSEDVQNISSRLPPKWFLESMAIWPIEGLVACFYFHTDCAPFSVKINVTGALTFFVIIPWLTLRIDPRINYLKTTTFSQLNQTICVNYFTELILGSFVNWPVIKEGAMC